MNQNLPAVYKSFSLSTKLGIVYQAFFEECVGANASVSVFLQHVRQVGHCTMEELATLEMTLVATTVGKLQLGSQVFDVHGALIHNIRLKTIPREVCFVTSQNVEHVAEVFLQRIDLDPTTLQSIQSNLVQWRMLRAKQHELQIKLSQLTFTILHQDHVRYKEKKERKKQIDQTKRLARRQERQFVARVKKIPKYKLRQMQKKETYIPLRGERQTQ